MKVFVLSLLCAMVGSATAGSVSWPGAAVGAVAWPGAAAGVVAWPDAAVPLTSPLFKTLIPPQTKAFSYSTTQYINSLPASYPAGLHPQFAYQVPQIGAFSPIQQAYYPIEGPSYFPANNVFYPSVAGVSPVSPSVPATPIAPAAPLQPEGSQSFPEQLAGDADTAVIESAEMQQQSAPQQQQQAIESQQQAQSEPQFPPANTFPNFPPFPQIPQGSGEAPSFPSIPQFPQISLPGFPQFPQIPSGPNAPQSPAPSPPSAFPGNASGDKGLNDEDTVSVESV